jgi:hypothetical protein
MVCAMQGTTGMFGRARRAHTHSLTYTDLHMCALTHSLAHTSHHSHILSLSLSPQMSSQTHTHHMHSQPSTNACLLRTCRGEPTMLQDVIDMLGWRKQVSGAYGCSLLSCNSPREMRRRPARMQNSCILHTYPCQAIMLCRPSNLDGHLTMTRPHIQAHKRTHKHTHTHTCVPSQTFKLGCPSNYELDDMLERMIRPPGGIYVRSHNLEKAHRRERRASSDVESVAST